MSPLPDLPLGDDWDQAASTPPASRPPRGSRQRYLTRCRYTKRKAAGNRANGAHRRRRHRNYL